MRGSTDNIMDDMERTVNDGINTFKCLTKDARFVPGAGATEIELAKELTSYAEVRIYMYHTHSHTSHPPHTHTHSLKKVYFIGVDLSGT